jgi:hypothetical protein
MAHCIIAGGAESISSDGWLQTYSDYAVAKQETKTTTGEWD